MTTTKAERYFKKFSRYLGSWEIWDRETPNYKGKPSLIKCSLSEKEADRCIKTLNDQANSTKEAK